MPELICAARALAYPGAARCVEDEVIAVQCRDMHQAVDLQVRELHEETEFNYATDDRFEFIAHMRAHEVALEIGHHVAGRFVGAALTRRAIAAKLLHRPK